MKKFTLLCLAISGVLLTHAVYADSMKLVYPDNGHSYKRFDTFKTWIQAKNACASRGGHLATITSQPENDWIKNRFLQANPIWLGANDAQTEGTWKWITGEAFDYTEPQWGHNGEPSNGGIGEDYLALMPEGHWNDGGLPANNSKLVYLCEWDSIPTEKLYSQVNTVPDINGNGAPELVLLGEQGINYKLFVYDSQSQALLSEFIITTKDGFKLKSFSVVNDSNGNGAPELAILISKTVDQTSTLQIQDILSGVVLKTLNLPKN